MSDFAAVRIHSKMASIFSSRPIISRKRCTDGDDSSMPRLARPSRKMSSSLRDRLVLGRDRAVGRRIAGDLLDHAELDQLVDAVVDVLAHAPERLHDRFGVERLRRAARVRKRRMPARSGDCTSVLKRVSRSGAPAAWRCRRWRGARRRSRHPRATSAGAAAARRARPVDLRSGTARSAASSAPRRPCDGHGSHRRRAAAGLDEHVREEQVGVDADRGHMDNMDRMFFSAEQLRRVVNDRRSA